MECQEKHAVSKSERIDSVDIFRGIGILLMVMGHVGFGAKFDYFIHAFHMPMFFFVSGYFYKDREIRFIDFLWKKVKTLLFPYAVFGLFHYFVWIYLNRDTNPLFNWHIPYHLLWNNTDGMPIAGALWFLTALFFVDILYFLLNRCIKNKGILTIVVGVFAVFGCIAASLLPFRLPWALDAALVGLGLYHIARLMKDARSHAFVEALFHMKWFVWWILGLACTALIFWNGYINMRTGSYANIPLFWFNAILATLIGWSISDSLDATAQKFQWMDYAMRLLKSIGRNSIVYLCLNQLVILLFTRVNAVWFASGRMKSLWMLLLTMFTLSAVSALIRHTKLRVIIGK